MEEKISLTVDPLNGKEVRFTDNSAKEIEGDFYPFDQTPKKLYLDPGGRPYNLEGEIDGYMIGDGDPE